MTKCCRTLAAAMLLTAVGGLWSGSVLLAAQGRAQRPNAPASGRNLEDPGVTPQEIQQMFDSYALLQAQQQLHITDEQFPKFLARFKALQDARRTGLQQRMRTLNALRQNLNAPQGPDENQLRDLLKRLDEIEGRTDADVKKAFEGVDQVLDVAQQAKFRVFEENMERRKLELITRARQANRPKNQQ